jgi:phospholipase C
MSVASMLLAQLAAPVAYAQGAAKRSASQGRESTQTPIQHVIVVVGENHTFDNVFGTYQPRNGQPVLNLLSQKIVNSDGSPGPNFNQAAQNTASDATTYSPTPSINGNYNSGLPTPDTTYAYGEPQNVPDPRWKGVTLANGPFQLTKHGSTPGPDYFGSFTGDPVHRFFQMWQDYDGGKLDLFTWVGQTIGTGSNGITPPFDTHQGGLSMGFNNMSLGDVPIFKFIADNYAMSDNYHQGVMGGTGANFIYLGTGDIGYFTDSSGSAAVPPANQIENPDPVTGTNNWYTNDGYGGSTVNFAGSYVNCADQSGGKYQPGVGPIRSLLSSLSSNPDPNCEPGHYYLVNNYNPAYKADGSSAGFPPPGGSSSSVYNLPPQVRPTIADSLTAGNISWKYYIGGENGNSTDAWCSICDPFQFTKSIMETSLRENIVDIPQFFDDLQNGNLPAVSFIRPYESYAGHPADSTLSNYELFIQHLVNAVISNPETFVNTAIFITMDEGGGYYDSGYIQPLDFFGDGTRIPLLVVSPYVKAGYIDQTYYDHGSILKFVEANWGLSPLSGRSRDNLPDPVQSGSNIYVPQNAPALGDLMNLFDFSQARSKHDLPLIIPAATS